MVITHNFTMALNRRGVTPVVDVVQGDSLTRKIEIKLTKNGSDPWTVPGDVTAAVAFRKPDGHKGLYDKLPDGSNAVTISNNTVTAVLAPEVLSFSGEVSAAIVLRNKNNLNQLATFPVCIRVAANPAAGQAVSNDYYSYSTMEEVSDAVEAALEQLETDKQKFLAEAEKALEVVHDTATENAPAIVCKKTGSVISANDASDRPLKGLVLYGKTTQDGTPTPENPVDLVTAGASGTINTTVAGKNLFGGDALADKFVEVAGATKNESGGAISFQAVNATHSVIFDAFKENKQYTFMLYGRNVTSGTSCNVRVVYTDGTYAVLRFPSAGNAYCIYTSTPNKTIATFRDYPDSGITAFYYNQCGIFEGVLTQADFEPYKSQTLTSQTPNGLNSIGEVKDEIDFFRGVRVRKIGRIDSYAGEEIPGAFMSTTGELSTGAKVVYVLSEPIETPLSAEELARYAALHTNKPNTTVYNDAGAEMKLQYVADTKIYIDNKFYELAAAIVNNA